MLYQKQVILLGAKIRIVPPTDGGNGRYGHVPCAPPRLIRLEGEAVAGATGALSSQAPALPAHRRGSLSL